ncbi:MAG: protein translocase subunit SecD [Deltaproteobacteria bacterium]|nr:protein translocase subunit SecD [Deltaproteobacteria bacterium]
MHCKKFNLGLDLYGGVHLVMGVEVEKAVQQRADRLADALRQELKEQKINFSNIIRPRDNSDIIVTLTANDSDESFKKIIRKEFKVLHIVQHEDRTYTLAVTGEYAEHIRESAVEQAIKTIRNRADKLGVTEPTIAKRGTDNILIQLPGVRDPDRAIAVIGRTAQLEFKIVDAEATAVFDEITNEQLPQGVTKEEHTFTGHGGKSTREVYFETPYEQKEALEKLLTAKIPSDREILFGDIDRKGSAAQATQVKTPQRLRTYLVTTRPGITGDYLTDANVEQDPKMPGDYYVSMTFDQKGAQIFAKLTEENEQRMMAIVLDEKVNSAPVIQEKIGGGSARITLGGNYGSTNSRFEEAKDLATVLKAGALPAPVDVREKRQVGKTMGEDTARKGQIALVVGVFAVLIFMVFYYRVSGLIANFGLILNFVLLLAIMVVFEATLTLPGMAGIALTLGMAVDANVLICERIREELRLGKTPRAAIDTGYSKAFSAIFDSNVTTLIAAVVLMQYGTGPVRGFAVTLIIGLLCSLYTSVIVSRLIYDFITSSWRIQRLSI